MLASEFGRRIELSVHGIEKKHVDRARLRWKWGRAAVSGGVMARSRELLRFAHRGASALAPENTLAAFQVALEHGCHWIETDLRVAGDGCPVLLHDATVDRTTPGRGAVNRLPLSRLRRLDAGAWFDARFRGERIPTLDEALEWQSGRCGLNLEIKEAEQSDLLIDNLARRLAGHPELESFLFSSFRVKDLRRLRNRLPHARLAWLVSRSWRGLKSIAEELRIAALHPKDPLATLRLVRHCHRMELSVHVWVVNAAGRLSELSSLEVDGIMTDDPRIFSTLKEP